MSTQYLKGAGSIIRSILSSTQLSQSLRDAIVSRIDTAVNNVTPYDNTNTESVLLDTITDAIIYTNKLKLENGGIKARAIETFLQKAFKLLAEDGTLNQSEPIRTVIIPDFAFLSDNINYDQTMHGEIMLPTRPIIGDIIGIGNSSNPIMVKVKHMIIFEWGVEIYVKNIPFDKRLKIRDWGNSQLERNPPEANLSAGIGER